MDEEENSRFEQALTLLEERRYLEAAESFSDVIALSPDMTGAYGNRGLCYFNLGMDDQARSDFETVLQLDPDDAMGHSMLADMARFRGEPEEALEQVTLALERNPDEPQAHFIRGWLFAKAGQYEMAAADLSRFLCLTGEGSEVEDFRDACVKLAKDDPRDASGKEIGTPEGADAFLGLHGWSFTFPKTGSTRSRGCLAPTPIAYETARRSRRNCRMVVPSSAMPAPAERIGLPGVGSIRNCSSDGSRWLDERKEVGEIRLSCYAAPWGVHGHVQAVSDVADCGFDGLEFPSDVVQRYEDRLHVFEEILDTTGLRLSGLIQKVDFIDKDKADEQVELAANSARFVGTIGRGNLVVCQSRPIDFPLSDDDWITAAAIAEEIGSRCRDFKVTLCFMPRARHFGDSEKDLKRFLAMTSPDLVSLALDSAELTLAGMDPAKTVTAYADRVRTVRLRDVSGSRRRAETSGSRPGITPQFGRGAVNFEALARAILDTGYEGWIVVDVKGETAQPKEAADAAYRFIKRRSGLFHY